MDAQCSAEEHFRLGEAHLAVGRHAEALDQFRNAHRLDPASARYRSFYGLCIGIEESRFDRALELCRAAAKEEFFNPVLYHNLARVHLVFGFKAEAIRYLRRGLMIDPASAPIRDALALLGVRRRPVLGFLRRRHLLNRFFGRLLRRDGQGDEGGLEAFRA